jgi:hypothetical protein
MSSTLEKIAVGTMGLLMILALSISCTGDDNNPGDVLGDDSSYQAASKLLSPEAIIEFQGKLVVVSPATGWDNDLGRVTYGQGFLTMISPDTMDAIVEAPVTGKNPQVMVSLGDRLAVVCSGTVLPGPNGELIPDEPGGVELFNSDLQQLAWIPIQNQGPHELSGFPGSAAAVGGKLYIGSGSAPQYWVLDLGSLALIGPLMLPGADQGSDLISVVKIGERVGLLSFSDDRLFIIDQEQAQVCEHGIELTSGGQMAGPISAVLASGELYVLLSMSSSLISVIPDACELAPDEVVTGAAPNQVIEHQGYLYIVNSLDNNVQRVDLGTGHSISPFAVLPPGANPWGIVAVGSRAYVTGYMDDTLYEFDLTSGEVLRTFGREGNPAGTGG